MRKVLAYSALLLSGLAASQLLPGALGEGWETAAHAVKLLTMIGLAFIMIHVGHEFDLRKAELRSYGWDYVVAMTAAAFPWLLVTLYFVFVLAPASSAGSFDQWKESLLQARFAAPTSAGVLFAMLAAAGLAATWVFRKARVLAIFDDLDTIILMVPLTFLFVGFRWQLVGVVIAIGLLLWAGWKYLHRWRIPYRWPWVLGYAVVLAVVSEAIYLMSGWFDPQSPIHFEVLLPAFILGCVMARPAHGLDELDALEGMQPGPDDLREQRVASIVSGAFMVLVGLSMPSFSGDAGTAAEAGAPLDAVSSAAPGWGAIAAHVLAVTVLSNVGKMFPVLCYRREASLRERLALSICLFPRGEVGAGVLVVSLSYGIGGIATTVALLSLALNLLLTGVFIIAARRLLEPRKRRAVPEPTPGHRPRWSEVPRHGAVTQGGHR